jgi:uncharacterized protein YndB with AHSA1/START domain
MLRQTLMLMPSLFAAAPCASASASPSPLSVTVTARIAAPREAVFRFTTAEDVLPKILHRYGPIPATVGTKVLSGTWDHPVAERIVAFEDGGTLHEHLLLRNEPSEFGYRIDQFANGLEHLANFGEGHWTFEDDHGATLVSWTYSFEPRSWVSRPVLAAFLKLFYKPFMQRSLDEIRRHCETEAALPVAK